MMLSKMLCSSFGKSFKVLGLGLALTLSACARGPKKRSHAPDPGSQAKRISASFLRCVELSGADCVQNPPEMRSWDAVALLAWIYEASPVSVLGALNAELSAHAELEQVQKRFVKTAQKVRVPLQGAGCRGHKSYPMKEVLGRLVPAVKARLSELGMFDGAMENAIEALANEGVRGVGQGRLVQMQCAPDAGLTLYTVVTKVDGKLQVVGLSSTMPALLLGGASEVAELADPVNSKTNPKLFAQGAESYVHPWVDLDWELY